MPDRPSPRRNWRRTGRRALRRSRKYLRKHRNPIRWGLIGAGTLVGLGLVWIMITALLARQQAQHLEDRLQTVRQLLTEGRLDEARHLAEGIPAIADRAHDLTTGPAWWVGSHLPFVGDTFDVTRGTMAAGAKVSSAVPDLMKVVAELDPANLRVNGDTLRLQPLEDAAPTLAAASHTIDEGASDIAALPSSTWLGFVDRGRDRIAVDINLIRGYVDAASRVAQVLPTMLGKDQPQTYFIGLQNEAELRGTGGLPGAFAIARAYHGAVHFTHFYSDAKLLPPGVDHRIPTKLDFGRGYESAYGPSLPTTTFVDSNVSPNFPYAAQIWQAMWEKRTGQHVDGVLALDPTVLSYFLSVTGPAKLPNGTSLDATNVITFTERDEYAVFSNNIQRKRYIVAMLKAASTKLTSGAGSAFGILHAASLAGSEQRLLAWSEDPRIERVLEESHFAGAIPQDNRPFSAVVLNNASGGKLDFYLVRAVEYERTGCGDSRDVTVTISLTNNAPEFGLPPYVVNRLDRAPPDAKPGDYRSLVDLYATPGAQLESVTLNGKRSTAAVERDLGHPIFRFDLELPRDTTQILAVHLREPAGVGSLQVWRQPGVAPLQLHVYDQRCG